MGVLGGFGRLTPSITGFTGTPSGFDVNGPSAIYRAEQVSDVHAVVVRLGVFPTSGIRVDLISTSTTFMGTLDTVALGNPTGQGETSWSHEVIQRQVHGHVDRKRRGSIHKVRSAGHFRRDDNGGGDPEFPGCGQSC